MRQIEQRVLEAIDIGGMLGYLGELIAIRNLDLFALRFCRYERTV
jgi:hypothetical protein